MILYQQEELNKMSKDTLLGRPHGSAALWQDEGHKLIVCLDANEDVYKKAMSKALTDTNGLAMKEVVGKFTGQQLGATFFLGLKPIDAVWAMDDIKMVSARVMPTGYRIGDH